MPLNPATGEFYENMTTIIPMGLKPKGIGPKLNRRGWITPDFSRLKLMKSIPLFVYGTEMTDGTDNHFLEGAKLLGHGHTLSAKFWMKQTAINPIVFDSVQEDHKDNRKVRGEVYEVQIEHIHMLDVLHKNRISTRRTLRNIVFEDAKPPNCPAHTKLNMAVGKCFTYIGSKTYWKDYDLRFRVVKNYIKKEGLTDIPFYEWVNWSPIDEEDEWGWFGRWGRDGYAHSPHVG